MGAQLCTALLQLRDLDNKILQYWRIAFHSKHLLLEACLARGVPSKWNGMVHRRPFQGIEIEDDTPPEIETHIIESQSNYQTGSGSGVQQLAKKRWGIKRCGSSIAQRRSGKLLNSHRPFSARRSLDLRDLDLRLLQKTPVPLT